MYSNVVILLKQKKQTMTTKSILSLVLITASTLGFSQSKFDLEKSAIKWTGKKITNNSHTGSLKFKSAYLSLEDVQNPSGIFEVNMSSLSNEDQTGEWKQKLEGHLKSEDFFSVEKYPDATLVLKEIKSKKDNSYSLRGELTIKDITHSVDFNLVVYKDKIEGELTFDRSEYNVKYASGSFFENLGDNLILDEVTLKIKLQKL